MIAAARLGARAIGIEFDPELVALSTQRADEAGVSDLTEFVAIDLFEYDLSRATVITLFLLPDLNYKLRPTLFALQPGTRIVSNTWRLDGWDDPDAGNGWAPDETVVLDPCPTWCTSLLWVVPAKVEGTWRLSDGELSLWLAQTFQMVSGTLRTERGTIPIEDGRLRGAEISFRAGDTRLHRQRRRHHDDRHRSDTQRGCELERHADPGPYDSIRIRGLPPGRGARMFTLSYTKNGAPKRHPLGPGETLVGPIAGVRPGDRRRQHLETSRRVRGGRQALRPPGPRQPLHHFQDAIDAKAYRDVGFHRFDVDVAGALLDGEPGHRVRETDDRSVLGRAHQILLRFLNLCEILGQLQFPDEVRLQQIDRRREFVR